MKRIQVIMTVLICALMMCCGKKEAELPNGGILNISFLDSIGFPDSIRDVEDFSFTYNGNTYLYCNYCPMLDSAKIEFNKRFGHVIPDYIKDIEEHWKGQSEEDKKNRLNFCENSYKETGFYPQEIIYESERDFDTIINKTIYTFTTSLNPHRDYVQILKNDSDTVMETFN